MRELQARQENRKRIKVWGTVGGVVLLCIVVAVAAFYSHVQNESADTVSHHETEAGVPISVNFAALSTTEEEYGNMGAACEAYIQSLPLEKTVAAVENSLIDVNEDTFIDAGAEPIETERAEPAQYLEYDRIYFEDFLLIRYVNEFGELQVVGASLSDGRNSETEIVGQEEFCNNHFNKIDSDIWNIHLLFTNEAQEPEGVSEETFIACVEKGVADMLAGQMEAETFFSHFTSSGETALLRIGQVLEIDANCTLEVQFGAAGKSDLSLETMDRLYLRYQVTRGQEINFLNVLVKLNQEMMVFDVDIL